MLWFRNLQIYRLSPDHALSAASIADALAKRPWLPCGTHDLFTQGWVPPTRFAPDLMAWERQDAVLVTLKTEEKILPGPVIKEEVDERIAKIEAEENRRVGRKEAKELKERVTDELIPKAFSRSRSQRAIIDLQAGLVLVESASAAKAEQLLSILRETLGSLPTRLVNTQTTPQTAMTLWLENPAEGVFDLGQDAELREPGDGGAVARLTRQALDTPEVLHHLETGKLVAKLALSWDDKLAFQLTEKLEIKRLTMLDVLQEQLKDADGHDQQALFEGSFALTIGELRQFVPVLIEALGGEMPS
ncbi:recombination associated protein RdgC [Andreprevotia lacus DSM 23236]|jgi:recombination associated protein RdgC|uniref:Recombination-associated protein RdgC n=1 Tax=Andreprevotia lacus DSM 23236 TaxID=1121001 RepID=A0A1W1XI35_9NEIS|nr:recombination-associated protein RdgC [Andreprevotia lacus]SMC23168.1 recombination associated protein RdgC [Andreprevotia lacus DSM 23236]